MLTQVLTEDTEVEDLVAGWSVLADRQDQVTAFQHPGWAMSWWRTIGAGEGRRMHIVVCFDGDDLVGVVPLFLEPADRQLRFLGHPLNDRNGAVAAPRDLLRVWAATARTVERLGLGFSATDMSHADVAPCAAAFHPGAAVTTPQPSPAIELPGSWSEYIATLKPRRVAGWRRDRRRLAAGAAVHVDHLTGAALGWDHLREFHRQRLRRWHAVGRITELSAVERSDALVNFLEELARGLSGTVAVRLVRLVRDDVVVAHELCLTWGDVVLDYMRTFEPAFARHGPGMLAALASVRAAISDRRGLYDFGRGDESYKFVLGATARAFSGIYVLPRPATTVR